jgi:hypothetical protein
MRVSGFMSARAAVFCLNQSLATAVFSVLLAQCHALQFSKVKVRAARNHA